MNGANNRQPPTHHRADITQPGHRGSKCSPEQTCRNDHSHDRHSNQDQGQPVGAASNTGCRCHTPQPKDTRQNNLGFLL